MHTQQTQPNEPFSDSWAETRVHAEAMDRKNSRAEVWLEREIGNGTTFVAIETSEAIEGESDPGYPTRLKLKSPRALHALIAALTELTVNGVGIEILESIIQ